MEVHNKMKPEVGTTVYLKAVGNNARYDKEVRIEEYKITKVGRKFFEVNDNEKYKPLKFHIEDLSQEMGGYIADWQLYFYRQDILDEEESEKLNRDIKTAFGSYGGSRFTLDQLRRLKEIISE